MNAGIQLAKKMWPPYTPADGSAFDGYLAPKVEQAKRWLGEHYLCFKPVNRKSARA